MTYGDNLALPGVFGTVTSVEKTAEDGDERVVLVERGISGCKVRLGLR